MNDLTKTDSFDLSPKNLAEAMEFSNILAKSSIVPKDFQKNPGNILVAIQWGMELGLKPMQAMQNIAVINGRPSLWGDSVLAIVQAHPSCEYVSESFDDKAMTAYCEVKRKGEPAPHVAKFSMDDAKTAGLANKQGPWKQYPKRMLQMRARAFALRDKFSDALKGMPIAEEVRDYQEKEINPTPAGASSTLRSRLGANVNGRSHPAPIDVEAAPPVDVAARLQQFKDRIQDCDTQDEMKAVGVDIANASLPDEALSEVRTIYAQHQKTIESCNKDTLELAGKFFNESAHEVPEKAIQRDGEVAEPGS